MSSSVGTGTERRISRRISSASRSRILASVVGTSRWPKTGSASALHVVGQDVVAAVEHRERARGVAHLLDRAGARAHRELGVVARRPRERDHVGAHRQLETDRRDRVAELGQRRPVGERLLRQGAFGRLGLQDPELLAFVRVAELDAEQEAVELRLGQRERALELDRVLRREDEERVGERVGLAVDGHLALLHRLEQRRLRLGGRAVDLVGQQDLREQRARAELEVVGLQVQDRGAGDVARHQVGRELHALEPQPEQRREDPDERGLADPRDVVDQDVVAREDADHHQPERLTHAEQPLVDPVGHLLEESPRPLGLGHRAKDRRR